MVVNIMLVLILIHYALYLIIKPKGTTLSCGLFGWFGKDIDDFDRNKLNILGVYNDSRGGDSCGVSVDGEIQIGIGKEKLFKDFIVGSSYSDPRDMPTIFGHTRKASVGGRGEENVHPFGFGAIEDTREDVPQEDIKSGENYLFEFVGAHNGTLLNHEEIAERFEVDTMDRSKKIPRKKIDSEILLESIYISRSLKPLSFYEGAAALIWTDKNEPNVVYLFRGESKLYPSSNTETSERPLYYYKESKNSMFVSSLFEPLFALSNNMSEVKEIDANTVYKITDGDIDNAVKFKISRKSKFQKESYHVYSNYRSRVRPTNNSSSERKRNNSLNSHRSNIVNIYNEIAPKNVNSKVQFNKLRYWRNNVLVTGIYTWVPKYGYVHLCRSVGLIDTSIAKVIGKKFSNGFFVEAKSSLDLPIPFKGDREVPIFYFVNGIRLNLRSDYAASIELSGSKNGFNWEDLSHCSSHPVIDIGKSYKAAASQGILLKGKPFSGTICPLGSNKIYRIVDGNLRRMKEYEKIDFSPSEPLTPILVLPESTQTKIPYAGGTITDPYHDYIPASRKLEGIKTILSSDVEVEEEIIGDLIANEVEKILREPFKEFPNHIKSLTKFGNDKISRKTIAIFAKFLGDSSAILKEIEDADKKNILNKKTNI